MIYGYRSIFNSSGVEMTRRSRVKFANSTVTDDSVNDWTLVTPNGSGGGEDGPEIINSSTGTLDDVTSDEDSVPASSIVFLGAAPTITGLEGGTPGRRVALIALGADVIIRHNNAGSVAANRFLTSSLLDVKIPKYSYQLAVWESQGLTSGRWHIAGSGAVSVGASGEIQLSNGDGTFRSMGPVGANDQLVGVSGDVYTNVDGVQVAGGVFAIQAADEDGGLVGIEPPGGYDDPSSEGLYLRSIGGQPVFAPGTGGPWVRFTFTGDANQTLTADEARAGVLEIYDDSATTAGRVITNPNSAEDDSQIWIINHGSYKHQYAWFGIGTIYIEPGGRRLLGSFGGLPYIVAYGDGADQATSAIQVCGEQGQFKSSANIVKAALNAGSGLNDNALEYYNVHRHYQTETAPERREEYYDANDYGFQFSKHGSKNVAANASATLLSLFVPDVDCLVSVQVKAVVVHATDSPVSGGDLVYKAQFRRDLFLGALTAYGSVKDATDPDFRDGDPNVGLDITVISDTEIRVSAITNLVDSSGPETNFVAVAHVQVVYLTDL